MLPQDHSGSGEPLCGSFLLHVSEISVVAVDIIHCPSILSPSNCVDADQRPIVPCRVIGASGSMVNATRVEFSVAVTGTSSSPITRALSV